MKILFMFLDGVGLGEDDAAINPFISAHTPTIDHLMSGLKLLEKNAPFKSKNFTLLSIDAQMGINGLPQSATGQATLLTGVNFPKVLGYHYGPKPNKEMAGFFDPALTGLQNKMIDEDQLSIFAQLTKSGRKASLLNAYPPEYFLSIESRKRNYSVIPLAATSSGLRLFNQDDLKSGKALSADFTGQGWRDHLNIHETPILTEADAGILLANLSKGYQFSMFEFWETDIIGHKQSFQKAFQVIEKLDIVLGNLLDHWDLENDGIIITSDHGNLEDLSTRRHTFNRVPAIFLGPPAIHNYFLRCVKNIGDIAPFIMHLSHDL